MNKESKRKCPLCFSSDVRAFAVDHGGRYDEYHIQCNNCGIELDTGRIKEEDAWKDWERLWEFRRSEC